MLLGLLRKVQSINDITFDQFHCQRFTMPTLRSLLDERFILSKQGSKFLENTLSEQAKLSMQGEIIL